MSLLDTAYGLLTVILVLGGPVLVGYLMERIELRTIKKSAPTPRRVFDEAALLGPVSAWVAEGEARAVREWEGKSQHRVATEGRDR